MSRVWQSPGSSSAPLVGEGHCPSRDVTPDTEARWFRGITGGSLTRPYNGGGRNGMFFSLYELPPISNLSPFLFRQPEGDFSPPASLPLSSPLVRGGHGCGNPRIFHRTHRRGGAIVKSNMVYRLCNNMVYTFTLGSPSIR